MRVVLTRHAERQLDKLHRDIAERSGEIGPTASSAASSRLSWLGAFPPDLLAGLRTLGFERRATIAFVV